mmetsp:Transcript_25638/g.42050  ORF Transcript_25638/g.42050 Transcript_25638/m.42050 type:complete len:160 (-) Transcript_25638:49-528(-)
MAALVQPFVGYTIYRHEVEVLERGDRPCLVGYNYWPNDLALLIDDCWSGDMKDRPKINGVIQRLDDCINELTVPVMTKMDEKPKMSARSILAGTSQPQLSSQKDFVPSSSAISNSTDDQERKGKNKMRQILASLPAALPAFLLQKRDSSSQSLRKNTAA